MRGEDVPFSTTASSAITFKANVGIGSPPTFYTLIVDTGSANTWISARGSHPFNPTETSRESKRRLAIKYGTGCFRGRLWFDRVTLGNLVIENQGIGVAENAFGFESDVDGILGLGLEELTRESLVKPDDIDEDNEDSRIETIPTVVDSLFAQGKIRQKTLALSFDRMSTTIAAGNYANMFHGVMTFGDTDPSKYTGEITYVPIPQDRPSAKHWSLEQKIRFGSSPETVEILQSGIGVIDTGCSVVHLERNAFDIYRRATGAHLDPRSGLLSLPKGQDRVPRSIFFEIGGAIFEIPPEEQIWPQELNDVAGGPADDTYLVYVELMNDSGVEISHINGFTWLQHFYTVLDVENKRIGVAKAAVRPGWSTKKQPAADVKPTTSPLIFNKEASRLVRRCISYLHSSVTPLLRLPTTLSTSFMCLVRGSANESN